MASERHHHVHLDEAESEAWADHMELEGEAFLSFVTETAAQVQSLRRSEAPPVRQILDIGSGPGVGTCELARRFPDAIVIAVDSSLAMIDRVTRRASAGGLGDRVRTQLAELPDGVRGLGPVDVIWASMSLHHIGDEVAALQALRDALDPSGLLVIAELGDPTRVLLDDAEVGRPGFADRLDRAGTTWFAEMRAGLPGSSPSSDLRSMLGAAGFTTIEGHLATVRLDAPLSTEHRRLAIGHLRRAAHQLAAHLDDDDLEMLAALTDVDDPRSIVHRPDLSMSASRQIVIARPERAA
jgi:trans-aconitate methyltransferase